MPALAAACFPWLYENSSSFICSFVAAAFLMSSTILVLVSFLGIQVGIFDAVAPAITNMLKGILTLFVPATIIVALRAAFVYVEK